MKNIESNTKELSCGVVILFEDEILIGHPTNNNSNRWNIPKGHKEDFETHIECAIRECFEESGICLWEDLMIDLGKYTYLPYKDLYLFGYILEHKIDIKTLSCESYFTDTDGRQKPEMDDFKYIKISDIRKNCSKELSNILTSAIHKIKKEG